MALSLTNIANYLFKKAQGKGSTNDSRQFFEEPRDGLPSVFPSQVWNQMDDVPTTAPVLADQAIDGVVQYWDKLVLTAVPGVSNSFFSDDLKDAIPFNFGDGSYNYALFDSTDAPIAFGQGDWLVDREAGLVTYYGTTPSNQPPKISFYKYVGTKGVGSGTGGGGGSRLNLLTDPSFEQETDDEFTVTGTGTLAVIASQLQSPSNQFMLECDMDAADVISKNFATGANYDDAIGKFSGWIKSPQDIVISVDVDGVLANSVTITGNSDWQYFDLSFVFGATDIDIYFSNANAALYYIDELFVGANTNSANHNDLTNKQGGTTDEYYHMTEAEYLTKRVSDHEEHKDNLIDDDSTPMDSLGSWTQYKDAGATPTDGTGGTPDAEFSVTRDTASTDPVGLTRSINISTDNLFNCQGNGVANLMTVRPYLRGNVCEFSFLKTIAGSYVDGDLSVYFYDNTNGLLLTSLSGTAINSSAGRHRALVYVPSSCTSLRVIIHCTTTVTATRVMLANNFDFKLADTASVPLIQILTTTPTINNFGTVTNAAFNWTVVGDRLVGNGRWTNGTVAAGTASFTLPNGWTSNVPGSDLYACGRWERGVSAGSTVKNGTLMCQTGNGTIFLTQDDYTTASAPGSGANANVISGNSNTMYVWFSIPISQLSQNTAPGLAQQSLLSYSSSSSGSLVAFPTAANTYGDAASFVLKGGRKYKVTYQLLFVNAGVITSTGIRYGVSTSSGNAFADAANGLNFARGFINTASGASTFAPIEVTLSPTTDTTYYLKQRVDGSTTNVEYAFGYTVEELAYSNTTIVTGPIFLGDRALTDDQTNATTTAKFYLNGPFIEMLALMTFTGVPTGSEVNMTIPTEFAASSFYNTPTNRPKVGEATLNDGGAPYGGSANLTSTTNLRIYGNNSGSMGNITTTNPFTWASGDTIFVHAKWLKA